MEAGGFFLRQRESILLLCLPMVASSTGAGGSGSDRQCMADFFFIMRALLGAFVSFCGFVCKFQTLPTITLHFVVVGRFC